MRYQAGLTIAAISVAVAAASPAHAHSGGSHFLLRGDVMAPPAGFVDMCRTDATFCQIQVDAPPSPPPAFRDGRGATGLPAFAMTVTNMIAAVMPDIIHRLEKPGAVSFRVRAVARAPTCPSCRDCRPSPLTISRRLAPNRSERPQCQAVVPFQGASDPVAALQPWRVQPVLTGEMPLLVGETVVAPT